MWPIDKECRVLEAPLEWQPTTAIEKISGVNHRLFWSSREGGRWIPLL